LPYSGLCPVSAPRFLALRARLRRSSRVTTSPSSDNLRKSVAIECRQCERKGSGKRRIRKAKLQLARAVTAGFVAFLDVPTRSCTRTVSIPGQLGYNSVTYTRSHLTKRPGSLPDPKGLGEIQASVPWCLGREWLSTACHPQAAGPQSQSRIQ
jgi:hypothetical protein